MTDHRRAPRILTPTNQLSAQEAQEALDRISSSTDRITVNLPVSALPVLLGIIQGALDVPAFAGDCAQQLYYTLFQLQGHLADVEPGLVAALLRADLVGGDAVVDLDEQRGSISDVEWDTFTWSPAEEAQS